MQIERKLGVTFTIIKLIKADRIEYYFPTSA